MKWTQYENSDYMNPIHRFAVPLPLEREGTPPLFNLCGVNGHMYCFEKK